MPSTPPSSSRSAISPQLRVELSRTEDGRPGRPIAEHVGPAGNKPGIRAADALAWFLNSKSFTVSIRRIIVAYDGSPPACRALDFAAVLAECFRSSISLMHVIQIPMSTPEALPAWGGLLADEERNGAALLKEAVQSMTKRGVKIEPWVVLGAPAEKVAEAATVPDVDLVVAGTTGKHALARVVLGSVTTRLLHICTKPLLVVP
jgi:nucleotide-binding universal stress UspA family protein